MFSRLRSIVAWVFSVLARLGVTRITIALFAVLVISLALWGFQASSTPIFCKSCHEMRYYYNTWHASSHQSITCEQCHLGATLWQMITIKIGAVKEIGIHVGTEPIEGQVPRNAHVSNATCLKCHTPPQGELIYHSHRMTHGKHLARGMHCTQCHANVVHGGRTGYINTPTMASCFKCHDGQKAPNRCSLCHLKLGEIKTPVYNPAWITRHRQDLKQSGEQSCKICHGTPFCQSCHNTVPPHPENWLQAHQSTTKDQLAYCATCHAPRKGEVMARFCNDCHNARHAHGPQFLLTHPKEYQAKPNTCRLCHEPNFCTSCHQIYRPHPLDWISKHGKASKQKGAGCAVCHPHKFCEQCHTHGRPASHNADWIHNHGKVAVAGTLDCKECHTPQMCADCHSHNPPQTHRNGNWKHVHGAFALAEPKVCYTCHNKQFCTNCHGGVSMPHPENWRAIHGTTSMAHDRTHHCVACHDENFCSGCHGGNPPPSHKKNWVKRHGKASLAPGANCNMCHAKNPQLCQGCHALPMPHPKNWMLPSEHGATAMQKPTACATCHQKSDCLTCHKGMPPTFHKQATWRTQHSTLEPADGALCSLCHGKHPCQSCHQGVTMPHGPKWQKEHGAVYQKTPKVCAACHETTDECKTCHTKEVKQDPHPSDWAMTHKAKAKFEKQAYCFLCHKIDFCQQCHPGAKLK